MTSKEQPGPNIGTRVIAEHDRVKLWELKLDPGEASEWHAHENDYIFNCRRGWQAVCRV